MSDDFLHRLRAQPRPEFLARLKAKLDRQPLHSRARLIRSLAAGLLAGVSALAIASFALHGEFAGFHWSGWGHGTVGSDEVGARAGEGAASQQAPRSFNGAWPQNPWAVAQPSAPGKSGKRVAAGETTAVAIPQSSTTAPSADGAQYRGGAALIVSPYAEQLRVSTTQQAEFLTGSVIQRFLRGGFKQPQLSVLSPAQLFGNLCSGNSADFALAARRMTQTEAEVCARSGVAPALAVKLGSQTLIFVRSKLYGALPLSARDLYLALSKVTPDPANPQRLLANHRMTWNEVNPALPPDYIQVLGPSLSSWQGQLFLSLIMEKGCDTFASIAAMQNAADHDAACRSVREGDLYSEANAEGYPLFVQRLLMYPNAVGILGYPTYRRTGDALVAGTLDSVPPSPQSLDAGSYPGTRTFYLYVNRIRFQRMGSMRPFLIDAAGGAYEGFMPPSDADEQGLNRALAALSSPP